jgi:hypothetical protein
MGSGDIHPARVSIILLIIGMLVATGIQTSAGQDRPPNPYKFHSDFDLTLGKPAYVTYEQKLLEFMRSKNEDIDKNLARVKFNIDSMPEFTGLKSISSSDLSKINQINAKKLDILNALAAIESEKNLAKEKFKMGYLPLDSIADEFPNVLSVADYDSNKLPRARITSYELPEAFPNDFSKAFFIKVKIKSYQPYSIYSVLIGDDFADYSNVFQVPRSVEEFKAQYLPDQGSTELINHNSTQKGLRITQVRKWGTDSVEDTLILRHKNATKQFSKLQLVVFERTVTDCLNIIFDPSSPSLGSGNSGCENISTKRGNILAKLQKVVGETLLENEFNKYYAIFKESFEYGNALSSYADYPDPFLANTSELSLRSEKLRVEAKSLELQIQKNTILQSLKSTTITCIKGKLTKKVTAVNPKCPSGYKLKR